jgi:hypothetical protein
VSSVLPASLRGQRRRRLRERWPSCGRPPSRIRRPSIGVPISGEFIVLRPGGNRRFKVVSRTASKLIFSRQMRTSTQSRETRRCDRGSVGGCCDEVPVHRFREDSRRAARMLRVWRAVHVDGARAGVLGAEGLARRPRARSRRPTITPEQSPTAHRPRPPGDRTVYGSSSDRR